MELISAKIKKLQISEYNPDEIIQRFSKLNIKKLELEKEENILLGILIFKTKKFKINNYNKKYYLVSTNYYTDNIYTNIYPLSVNLNLVKSNELNKMDSYLKILLKKKFKYNLGFNYFEIYKKKNINIIGININKDLKNIKVKKTKIFHFYKDPNITDKIKDIYQNILNTNMNSLSNRFYFFYKNIKMAIKEDLIIRNIVG